MKTFKLLVRKTIVGYFEMEIEADNKALAKMEFYMHTDETPDILDCNGLEVSHIVESIK